MLEHLSFSNFKSWQGAALNFGRITGLFGTNSSGKTSILQFLLLLKQTKETTDRALSLDLNGSYVQLGVYKDVIYMHEESRDLTWVLQFAPSREVTLVDPAGRRTSPLAKSRSVKTTGEVQSRDQAAFSTFLSYSLDDMQFSLSQRKSGDYSFELLSEGGEFRFIRTQGRPWQLPGPVKSYAFPDQARTYFQNASFLSDLEIAYEEQIDKIYYLGPLREYPKPDYLWARSKPRDVGIKGEKAIDAILAATNARETRNLSYKARHKPFQEMIAHWLSHMGLIDGFRVEELAPGSNRWQVLVRTRERGPEAFLTDVGFGVSQVLPVVTLLQYAPEGSTVILEQPEIHLHPLAQAGLADVIINAALHRDIQIILESHSEHLLLRLQRRVAEEAVPANDVRLYFSDITEDGSCLDELKLDMLGAIENWPKNFMGDAFGETYAAEEARLRRLAAAK